MTLWRTGALGLLASVPLLAIVACADNASEPPPATPSAEVTVTPPSDGFDAGDPNAARGADSGLAWCTAPDPESIQWSTPISSSTTMRIYAGGCVPTDHYYRACDDAGMPVFAPACNDTNTGKRLELVSSGHTVVSLRADAIEGLPGAMPGDTWAVGPSERAVIIKTSTKLGEGAREETRVVALGVTGDDWQPPSEEFGKVVTYPKSKTFTFWRKAACVGSIGCTSARWEASSQGIRLEVGEKEIYSQERQWIRSRLTSLRGTSPACPIPTVLASAKIFAISRILGDGESAALAEFDKSVAGLSTKGCTATTEFGRQKPLAAIRQDLTKSVKKFLASTPRAPDRHGQ